MGVYGNTFLRDVFRGIRIVTWKIKCFFFDKFDSWNNDRKYYNALRDQAYKREKARLIKMKAKRWAREDMNYSKRMKEPDKVMNGEFGKDWYV